MKFLRGTILTTAILLLSATSIFAFSSFSTTTLKFDTSLTEGAEQVYTTPEKIYISQITTKSEKLSQDPQLWVKSLYYHYITRLYIPDLPYTYLLDENGIIYQGKTGGLGANLRENDLDNALLIGYLSNNPTLTARAETSLMEIVNEVAHDWGISTIKPVRLNIIKEENKMSGIKVTDASFEFTTSLNNLFKDWEGYKEENLKYKAKIDESETPKEVEIGNRATVKLKITNANDFPWFTDKEPIYISTKDGKESSLAINQVWPSFSKPVEISDKSIKPKETFEISFEIEAKVLTGEVKQSFVLQKVDGQPFEGSEFEVKFNVVKGDKTLVQVVSPEFGFVNIRKCRRGGCEIIDSPKEGSVFILLGEEEGWYKVQYAPGVEGWAMLRYFKKI